LREVIHCDAFSSYQKRNLDDNGLFWTYPHLAQYSSRSMHRGVDCG
jgi:hypothetical protein